MKRVPFYVWLIIIFILTSIPGSSMPQIKVIGLDKVSHLFLYSVLTLFLFFAYGKVGWKFLLMIFVIAAVDEAHQFFIPGRMSSFFDVIWDFAGAGVTFYILKS